LRSGDDTPRPLDPDADYDEEELSDMVDLFLTAGDTAPHARDWQRDIYGFFTEDGHKLSAKAHIVRSRYGEFDGSYRTDTGVNMHVLSNDEGMGFYFGNHISFSPMPGLRRKSTG